MTARLRTLFTTAYTILVTHCSRCGLPYDPGEKRYHTQPGGCR